jgi:hypothetical protein
MFLYKKLIKEIRMHMEILTTVWNWTVRKTINKNAYVIINKHYNL